MAKKAEEIAREEPGVAGVDDQTTIEQEAIAPPPPVEEPKPEPIIVPAGTVLIVRTSQALGSKSSQTGQTFVATLAQPVSVDGRLALPPGSTVSGTVLTSKAKGKIKGQGQLDLSLASITAVLLPFPFAILLRTVVRILCVWPPVGASQLRQLERLDSVIVVAVLQMIVLFADRI